MSGAGRHARPPRRAQAAEPLRGGLRSLTPLGVTAAVAALVAVATMVAAVLTASPAPAQAGRAGTAGPSVQAPVPLSVARRAADSADSTASPAPAAHDAAPAAHDAAPAAHDAAPGGRAAAPLTLTAADRHDCPAAATACVDLARHLTWLQSGGLVAFGPVQMEPGQPGTAHQTPRGTFHVGWKAGPGFVSDIYHEAMPWATFFAAGGIAFHGGSLTQWSHGCVHLTLADARYYNVHLLVGAEVVVF
jgi:lipoprotein-anchoring transpeptidase ErfK/SrfK